jgi:hypothetical protein
MATAQVLRFLRGNPSLLGPFRCFTCPGRTGFRISIRCQNDSEPVTGRPLLPLDRLTAWLVKPRLPKKFNGTGNVNWFQQIRQTRFLDSLHMPFPLKCQCINPFTGQTRLSNDSDRIWQTNIVQRTILKAFVLKLSQVRFRFKCQFFNTRVSEI